MVIRRAILFWIPLAVVATALSGLSYGVSQQAIRSAADDPQVQLAEDAVARLDGGVAAGAVIPGEAVELASSLAPYVMVFDRSGQLVASSATLHGQAPPYPESVFGSAATMRQDHVTWQPEAGVRSATVVQRWSGGFVVAGRSLRRAEERTANLGALVLAGWLVTLAVAAVACLAVSAVAELIRKPAQPEASGRA